MVQSLPFCLLTEFALAILVWCSVSVLCGSYEESNFIVAVSVATYLLWSSCLAILFVRRKSKVRWIHAMSSVAKPVIYFQSYNKFSTKENPRRLMRPDYLAVESDHPVSIFRGAGSPQPAVGAAFVVELDFSSESFNERFEWHKKAADSAPLIWPHDWPRELNRLKNCIFVMLFWADQSLRSSLHFAGKGAS